MADQEALPGTAPERYRPTLKDGTPLDEGISALIKSIRRGQELESVYWAKLIEAGGFDKYLWRRLMAIVPEEIAFAAPELIVQVMALHSAYYVWKKESKGPPDDGFIIQACLVLCRAPKNREIQWFHGTYDELTKDRGWKPEMPDVAVDMHTARGKPKFRGMSKEEKRYYWWSEGTYVFPEVGPYDWQLWWMRQLVKDGQLNAQEVEDQGRVWDEQGELKWGMDGRPPIPKP